jgi:peptidase E
MTGLSAGSLCWFEQGMTAFHGESAPVRGMGFLPHSNAVHYGTSRNAAPRIWGPWRRG